MRDSDSFGASMNRALESGGGKSIYYRKQLYKRAPTPSHSRLEYGRSSLECDGTFNQVKPLAKLRGHWNLWSF